MNSRALTTLNQLHSYHSFSRSYSAGWPQVSQSISNTTNFGHFSTNINDYPGWYRKLMNVAHSSGFSERYMNWMGYRRYGLRFEDILLETPAIQEALHRLPAEVLSDRDDRMKGAFVASSSGDILKPEKQTTKETDIPYLAPYLEITMNEFRDRNHFRPK